MSPVGGVSKGGPSAPNRLGKNREARTSSGNHSPRSRAQQASQVASYRERKRAEGERYAVPEDQRNHLIPDRELDVDPDTELNYIGHLLAGVDDFKILRSTTAVLHLTTSPEFRHILVDASVMSNANLLYVKLYEIPRKLVFGVEDDDEDEWEG